MEAYETTTTLVLLDVPPQTSLTLDTLSFSSTATFRGIKFIGPGIHLLTYGLDKSELGMRNGFFFRGNPGQVSAWQWNKATEELNRVQEQVQGKALQERLQALRPYLTILPPPEDETTTTWSDLTSYITVDLLNRVLPHGWTFSSQTPSTNDDATDQLSSLPSSKSESTLNFTSINLKRTFNPSSIGSERTSQILDKSYYLSTILDSLPHDLQILGELQMSFLSVLYMNNFSGFETWKKLLCVFCGCKSMLKSHQQLFRNFLVVLRHQFDMCSEETFNQVILEGNFIGDNLKSLNIAIEESKLSVLEGSFAQVLALLEIKFNWDPIYGTGTKKGMVNDLGFDEDGWDRNDGDYAPVVVDIDEEDEETMDVDVDYASRMDTGGHIDMKTGKMVFGNVS